MDEEVARCAEGATIAVPAVVRRELDRLVARSVPYTRVARELGRRYPTLPCAGEGDRAILACARRSGALLVTADRDLARRALESGTDVIGPRDRLRLTRRTGRARGGSGRSSRGRIKSRGRLVRDPR